MSDIFGLVESILKQFVGYDGFERDCIIKSLIYTFEWVPTNPDYWRNKSPRELRRDLGNNILSRLNIRLIDGPIRYAKAKYISFRIAHLVIDNFHKLI